MVGSEQKWQVEQVLGIPKKQKNSGKKPTVPSLVEQRPS
jgi:hypothetical protein